MNARMRDDAARCGSVSKPLLLLIGGLVFLSAGILFAFVNRHDKPIANVESLRPSSQSTAQTESHSAPEGWENIGGILRPKTDVVLKPASDSGESNIPTKVLHGFSPPVSPTANKQVEGVYAALRDRTSPNAFSSFATAKPFDAEAYKKDPQAYIETVEPSRVFSPAQPGEGVKAIRPNGSIYHDVRQGESVALSVETEPGAPVTFTSFDLGFFSNELTSITVQADDKGIASAQFTAGGGTIDDLKILAASPMTTGQVKFHLNVRIGS